MPIKNRLEMLTTGIKTPVGVKLFGPDLATLDKMGKQIEGLLPSVAAGGRSHSGPRTVLHSRSLPPTGAQVALGQVARIGVTRGATLIKSENAYLNTVVYVDVRDREVGSYVAEARTLIQEKLEVPPGYRVEWSGQFEAMQREFGTDVDRDPCRVLALEGTLAAQQRRIPCRSTP